MRPDFTDENYACAFDEPPALPLAKTRHPARIATVGSANPKLARPLAHAIRNDAEDTKHREEQRDRREAAEQHRSPAAHHGGSRVL